MPTTESVRRRDMLRQAIFVFCRKPRTMAEVRDYFKISGSSAASFLKFMTGNGLLRRREKTDKKPETFQRSNQRVLDGLLQRSLTEVLGQGLRSSGRAERALTLLCAELDISAEFGRLSEQPVGGPLIDPKTGLPYIF